MKKISIIIRTLNEAKYLPELLEGIKQQLLPEISVETIIVDSGSKDETINIAKNHNCKIVHIAKSEFSFGKSLNIGCEAANGEILVFVSGHCVPVDINWIKNLINPILKGKACYVYGRQVGRDTTMFSEERVFSKFFPEDGRYNSPSYFCNNANSAIKKTIWLKYKFNEEVTGLEDLELGKRLTENSCKIEYSNESCVYHIHNESWIKIKNRYERETLAFLNFEPSMKLSFFEVIKGFLLSLLDDLSSEGFKLKILHKIMSILYYRSAQYVGYWLGNKRGKNITAKTKNRFYYP